MRGFVVDASVAVKWAITTSETTNMVHWIDVDELEVITSIPVGRFPWGVAIRL